MTNFGNWIVSQGEIKWDSTVSRGSYQIPLSRLLELTIYSGVSLYEWLVHVPPKTWLSVQDVYDLNDAFKYLAKINNLPIDPGILSDSLQYQSNILKNK